MLRLDFSLVKTSIVIIALLTAIPTLVNGQQSIARQWNEINLEAVRHNGARPTVIARNLFHHSILMYDLWAVFDEEAETYFLGKQLGNYPCPFDGFTTSADLEMIREEAISFASYRLLMHRYASPNEVGSVSNNQLIYGFMTQLGYDPSDTSTDYSDGSAAHLGNYIADKLISAGLVDGSNEVQNYFQQYYEEVNPNLDMTSRGNDIILDMNRWQKMTMNVIWDQPCQNLFTGAREFIGPEWGNVVPFALHDSVLTVHTDDRGEWKVYHDPGPPPHFDTTSTADNSDYLWNFELVGIWSSHLDPNDDVMWDVSPASIGNIPLESFPEEYSDYSDFYDFYEGGDPSPGHAINPHTGLPYTPQIVKRSDYARILAEFWADGPDSEAPPGHWHTIYNAVSDYPDFTWKWEGVGEPLDHLEYDVKAYLTLAGAMHDAAVTAWGAKGYYDYIRPVAALRAISDKYGQRTDASETESYHPLGIDLIPGYIEIIQEGDPLIHPADNVVMGEDTLYIEDTSYLLNEIKLLSWLGPGNEIPCDSLQLAGTPVQYPTDISGVGWRPIQEWWPYQRPTFVTPPFAGYVSGHSTFSRAAAEVMTAITGDNYFPGGMGVFECPADSFLVFEEGPSEYIELQWATYQDASDQCSLSRIWGGIHPPADDIPGRKMGYEVGLDAFTHAQSIFDVVPPQVESAFASDELINDADDGTVLTFTIVFNEPMDTDQVPTLEMDVMPAGLVENSVTWTEENTLVFSYNVVDMDELIGDLSFSVADAEDRAGNVQTTVALAFMYMDMENPSMSLSDFQETDSPVSSYTFTFTASEPMDITSTPVFETPVEDALTNSLMLTSAVWLDDLTYQMDFDLIDAEEEWDLIDVRLTAATDTLGNPMQTSETPDVFSLDSRDPLVEVITANTYDIDNGDHGTGTFAIILNFDEEMDPESVPQVAFPVEDPLAQSLVPNDGMSSWLSPMMYEMRYDVLDVTEMLEDIDVEASLATDLVGNVQVVFNSPDLFSIHLDTILSVVDLGGLPISRAYPNPLESGNRLTIELAQPVEELQVDVLDLSGRKVMSEHMAGTRQLVQLDLADMSEGMYLVLLESEGRRSLVKLSVKH